MASCPTCANRFEDGQRVCHACGALRPDAIPTPQEERAVLVELRQALGAAMADAEAQKQPVVPVRDRFLRHALVPADPGLLIEEAVHCQTFFIDALDAETSVPQARFQALLARLEVAAVDDPALAPKIQVLRRQLDAYKRTSFRNGLLLALAILALLLAVAAAIVGLVYGISLLFR
jgi:hypothetical protein